MTDDDDEPTLEDLFITLFITMHATNIMLANLSGFEEWSAMEVLALRAFQQRDNYVLGTKDIAALLHCSMPWASNVIKRLRKRGYIEQIGRWRQYHSMRLTEAGRARLRSDTDCLRAFTRQVFGGFSREDRLRFGTLLGRVYTNVNDRRQLYTLGWIDWIPSIPFDAPAEP